MAPVMCSDDSSPINQKQLLLEASVLRRIPPQLFIQSSSSSSSSARYSCLQSFPNGKNHKSWLWIRRKARQEERFRKLARFHGELSGKSMRREHQSEESRINGDTFHDNEGSKENRNPIDREELLLDIALRTMILMHHNQLLQKKLNALQIETRNFVRSCRNKHNQRKSATYETLSTNNQ